MLLARAGAQQITAKLHEPQLLLTMVAQTIRDSGVSRGLPFDSYLDMVVAENPIFESIYLLDSAGDIIHTGFSSVNRGRRNEYCGADLSKQLWFRHAQATGHLVWSPTYTSALTGKNLMTLAIGIGDTVVAGQFYLSELRGTVAEMSKGKEIVLSIVDRDGTLLLHPDEQILVQNTTQRLLQPVVQALAKGDTTFVYTIDGVEYIGSVVSIAETGWLALVSQTAHTAYAPMRQLTLLFLGILGAMALLSAIGGRFMARWLSRLFALLSNNAQQIARGDYESALPAQRYRELEPLAENNRLMVRAIREREEQYRDLNLETRRNLLFQRTLLEAINIPVVYYTVHGEIIGCNSMFEEVMGLSRDQMLHFSSMREAPSHLHLFMDRLLSGLTGKSPAFDHSMCFHDGSVHAVIVHRAPFYIEEGAIGGYICVLLDVTQNRLTEDAFQRLIQSTVGIHGVDYFHRLVRLLCEWFGCDGALIGEFLPSGECKSLSMQINGLRVDDHTFKLKDSPAQRAVHEGFIVYEKDTPSALGGLRGFENVVIQGYAAVPLLAESGIPFGILELFSRSPLQLPLMAQGSMEILAALAASELLRMRAEREQVKLGSQLRQMEKMEAIGQLAGGIAHDINNQLGCIMGYTDISIDATSDVNLLSYLGKISQSVSRSADLVKKLLAFSRHGNFVVKPVNVSALINEVVGLLQHSIDKFISLSMVATGGEMVVMGDPSQLQNALLNLGLNARDAMPEGGTITYQVEAFDLGPEDLLQHPASSPGKYVCIKVLDTGVGMTPEVMARIFEPFYTTKEEGKGTGLGLAAVYGTVSSHRGTIHVTSTPGKGTVFTILLPFHAVAAEEPESVERAGTTFGSGMVLVIDDEIDIRETVAMTLRKCGYQVLTAGDGLEAIELLSRSSYTIDLVILDMVLPGLDGKHTFERLIEIDPTLKVIVVSGFSIDGRVQSVLDQGAKSFLQKPFQGADLLRMVSDVLGG